MAVDGGRGAGDDRRCSFLSLSATFSSGIVCCEAFFVFCFFLYRFRFDVSRNKKEIGRKSRKKSRKKLRKEKPN